MATNGNSEEEKKDKERERWYKIIEEKSRKCANPTFNCTLPVLDGCEFCMMHILRYPQNELYKQCVYLYTNRKRCVNAVKCAGADVVPGMSNLCAQHKSVEEAESLVLTPATNESLLLQLGVHLDLPLKESDDEDIDVEATDAAPSFIGYKHLTELKKHSIEFDSADRRSLPENVNRMKKSQFLAEDWSDSEADSIDDIDVEDCLKYGGVFTQEEIVRLSSNNLVRLQKLYKSEIAALYHKLKQSRCRYIVDCVKEAADSSGKLKKKSNKESAAGKWPSTTTYDMWLKYRCQRSDISTMLQNRAINKKRKSAGAEEINQNGKCAYLDHTIKCDNDAVVFSAYCQRHILNDNNQVLFEACTALNDNEPCLEGVVNFGEPAVCKWHTNKLPKEHVTPPSGPRIEFTLEQNAENSKTFANEIKKACREISNLKFMQPSILESMDIETAATENGLEFELNEPPLYDMLEEIHANL